MRDNKNSSMENDVRKAATVILVRDTHTPPFEIFLMRRHRNQSFMGGAFVFPGGTQEKKDDGVSEDFIAADPCFEQSLNRITAGGVSLPAAKSLFITAIRETFEESGILFAKRTDNVSVELMFRDPLKWNAYRQQLHNQAKSLEDIADHENIIFVPHALIPYARWITPEAEKKRFDTWFFIAQIPTHQTPCHDDVELVDSIWVTPEGALKKNDEKKILLMPPTLKTIEELSAFSSLDRVFEKIQEKRLSPILPQAIFSEMRRGVKLPHDPEYSIQAFKQKVRPEEPSRIMFEDGKWATRFLKRIPETNQ